MVRLGRISYVNMAPVFYRVDAEVEEVQGVPTELNRMLVAGELDTAPISSIAYALPGCGCCRASASRRREPSTRSNSSRASRSSEFARSR
jgi:hypothetical protein